METNLQLPQWLDNLIFNDLGAKYCRSNADMTVIDWDKKDVLNYLGTYFPRSYTESYCIFSEFFKTHPAQFAGKTELSIFDFGCGTGGEIIGLLYALANKHTNIKLIHIIGLDGNLHALHLYEKVLLGFQKHTKINITNHSAHIKIDDFYDLEILNKVLKGKFDIIISFKAICEFVTKQQFEQQNAYEHIAKFLLPKLANDGTMLLVDVSTYNNTSKEWLPMMLDRGLSAVNCQIVMKNKEFNHCFTVTHSRKINDISKVVWRLIKK